MTLRQPASAFNFRVYFSRPAPESRAFDAGAAQATSSSVAGPTLNAANAIGFAEVSGLDSELEVEEYREGGRNIGPRRFPKWGRYSNLVFRRGVTASTLLWDWWTDVLTNSFTMQSGQPTPRRNAVVLLERNDHTAAAGWLVVNALPERLVGPGLNARSNEIAIETLELSHEGVVRIANLPKSA
jgi:phage tail-like protein